MHRWSIGLLAVLPLASIAFFTTAAPPEKAAGASFMFIGYSDQMVTGDAGFAGMAAACQSKFGPESRMASTVEVIEATSFPPGQPGSLAWVRPVLMGFGVNSNLGSTYQIDSSGTTTVLTNANCNGWSSLGGSGVGGMVVRMDNGGIVVTSYCEVPRHVACSNLR